MSRKLSIENAKHLAQSFKGICLSKEYVNSKSILFWECKEKHIFKMRYNDVYNGHWCQECAGVKRLSLEIAQQEALKNNGICLSKEYKSVSVLMDWVCELGHHFKMRLSDVRGGHWCCYCGGSARKNIEDARRLAISLGGECLSQEYKNNRIKISWKCSQGHIFKLTYSDAASGHWCAECFGNKPKTLDDCISSAIKRNGECLSTEYINCSTKMRWRCFKGHEFFMAFEKVNTNNHWCPECGKFKIGVISFEITIELKLCVGCGKEKTAVEFGNSSNSKDGKKTYCKNCAKIKNKEYELKNKINLSIKRKKRRQERIKNDLVYKITIALRKRLSHFMTTKTSTECAIGFLGCPVEELKLHLESKFYPNPDTGEMMTWENHSSKGWHIDHIKPLASFNLIDESQVKVACHYTNLQPLWAKQNLSTGCKIKI